MAEQFNFKELDTHKRAEWLETRPEGFVKHFTDSVHSIFNTAITDPGAQERWLTYDMDRLAPNVYYYMASCQTSMPIQNMIGGIASILNEDNDRDLVVVWNSHQTAAEIVLALNGIFVNVMSTMTGKYVVVSLVRDPDLNETRMYPLPLARPMYASRPLGSYSWTMTDTTALDVLNGIPFTILNIGEEEPQIGTNPSTADKEKMVKFQVREAIRPQFEGKRVYYNWHSDYRGRMSPGAYHFNPHGNEYEKSIIAFAESQEVTWGGKKEYQKALARAAGLDKQTDIDKLRWYSANKDNLNVVGWKEPHTAKALLIARKQIEETGRTNIPVEVDSTNSQLQVIALLTGDLQTALSCNIVPNDAEIADAYGIAATIMSNLRGTPGYYSRYDIKQGMMVHGYGAGKDTVSHDLAEAMGEKFEPAITYELFLGAMDKLSPAAARLKAIFDGIWNPTWTEVTWTLPDGFVACYKPIETQTLTLNPFGIEMECLASVNTAIDFSTAFFVNIIHSVDAYIARQMVVRMKGKAWSIHDGFPMHGNNVQEGLQHYKDICSEIVESRLLEDILGEVSGTHVPTFYKQFGKEDIQKGHYAIS